MKRKWILGLSVSAGTLGAVGVVGFLVSFLYTPAPHDVHTQGGAAITNFHIAKEDRPTYGPYGLSPSLSLADIRCGAWQAIQLGPCPDAATLEQKFWPGVTQTFSLRREDDAEARRERVRVDPRVREEVADRIAHSPHHRTAEDRRVFVGIERVMGHRVTNLLRHSVGELRLQLVPHRLHAGAEPYRLDDQQSGNVGALEA